MRERRISRLMLRAEAAIESGALDEARDALQELERLDAKPGDLAAIRRRLTPAPRVAPPQVSSPPPPSPLASSPAPVAPARLSEPPRPVASGRASEPPQRLTSPPRAVPEPVDPTAMPLITLPAGPALAADLELRPAAEVQEAPTPRRRWVPGVAAAIVLFGAIAWLVLHSTVPAPADDRVTAATAASAVPQNTTQPNSSSVVPDPGAAAPAVHVAVDEVAPETIAESARANELPQVAARDPLPQPRATAGHDVPSPRPAPSAATEEVGAGSAPVVPGASVGPVAPVASVAIDDARAAPAVRRDAPVPAVTLERAPALPSPTSAPPDAASALPVPPANSSGSNADAASPRSLVPEDVRIRSTLARYEAAYSRLDASAAGAVWPGVDRRALARAFDGLASQQVNLGSCDVRVAGDTALADCSGSQTWTPKVGGGSRSQPRRWQFRLRNASDEWQIVGVTAR